MKSWRTLLSGLAVMAGIVVSHFWPEHAVLVTKLTAAAIGLGLMSARDHKVSSEEAGVK